MARLTKKQKEAQAKIDPSKVYSLNEASALVKEITNVNFDASVDLSYPFRCRSKKSESNGTWCCNLTSWYW